MTFSRSCLLFVLKAYLRSLEMLRFLVSSRVKKFVYAHHLSPISCSRTTVFFLSKLTTCRSSYWPSKIRDLLYRNVSDTLKHTITTILGVHVVLGIGKYLCLPSMISRDRNATFAYIKDRVWKKINSWSGFPSHVMRIFQLPTTLIDSIEKMMNSFWWGHGRTTCLGIHWMNWEKLSAPKIHGGASISILSEPWLHNGEFISSEIPGAPFVQNFIINSLMNFYDKSWNEQVIRQVFSTDITDKILRTPLTHQVTEDRIIWKWERHGRYSVRSAYRLFHLLDKGVVCPTDSASCDSNHEDLKHVFFYCPFVVHVWNRIGFYGCYFSLLEQLPVELAQRMATVLWSIWKHRNLKVWDNVIETSATVAEHARNMVVDWQLANTSAVLASTTLHQPSPTLCVGGFHFGTNYNSYVAAPYSGEIQMQH
ncbi:hypothetical protein MTR_6g033560 [Medicago truncatula]|uniref:Reverse transcriptase zinc-binding domain-containing protein n=1 Tax=Medicago truncatula TaxID=3880 RepID=A0A072U8K1_MEDTR|nr:hypothetical protein MTR_6g033560 [Medicago truncatula]